MSENRTAIIAKLVKVAKKHYPAVSPPAGRNVLENLLYACLLENSQFTAADEVFARLEQYSDWNEVRVTTTQELSEAATALSDPLPAIEHLKQVLHSLFETHYSFDLDFLIKENQGKAIAQLEKYKGVTPFVVSYLVQNSLGGHKIPVCAASLDFAEALGLLTPKEKESGTVPGFERAVPKTKGPEFFSTMHQLAVDFKNKPRDKQILAILKEINPEAVKRLDVAAALTKKPEAAKSNAAEEKSGAAKAESGRTTAAKVVAPVQGKTAANESKAPTDTKKATEARVPADAKKVANGTKPVAADKKTAPPSGTESKVSPPAKSNVAKPVEKSSAKPAPKPVSKPIPKKSEPTPPAKTGKPVGAPGKKPVESAKSTSAKKKPR